MCTTPPVVSKRNHKDGITGQSVTVTMVSTDMKSHRQVVYDVAMEWIFQYVSPELIYLGAAQERRDPWHHC